MKEFKTAFLTTLAIFVIFFLYVKFVGPIPFTVNSVQTTKTNLFSVDGTGKATGIPDTAVISFGVTKTAATVASAQNQTNTAVDKITQDLKNLGIAEKNIKTTDYSVNPNYDFAVGQSVTGYTVTQTLEADITPVDLANKAVDIATADGANLVNGISFTFSDKVEKGLEDKARADAVSMAKDKANSLAKATGIRLGRIIDVQESNNSQPRPILMNSLEMGGGAKSAAPTQLSPGENSVSIDITLSYETL